mmetsp:Transcript_27875/g.73534  ORF Transcript_27875/g.73534 Transcript_27875/m.73534 type:complete len:220 (-) Transcript_27875:243-902(-)
MAPRSSFMPVPSLALMATSASGTTCAWACSQLALSSAGSGLTAGTSGLPGEEHVDRFPPCAAIDVCSSDRGSRPAESLSGTSAGGDATYLSRLFRTMIWGVPSSFSSAMISCTDLHRGRRNAGWPTLDASDEDKDLKTGGAAGGARLIWCMARGEAASTTCSTSPASSSSSRVALKAATSLVGSFWMKPTVSDTSTSLPAGRRRRRVVGSRVANSRSSA